MKIYEQAVTDPHKVPSYILQMNLTDFNRLTEMCHFIKEAEQEGVVLPEDLREAMEAFSTKYLRIVNNV